MCVQYNNVRWQCFNVSGVYCNVSLFEVIQECSISREELKQVQQ